MALTAEQIDSIFTTTAYGDVLAQIVSEFLVSPRSSESIKLLFGNFDELHESILQEFDEDDS